MPKTKISDDLFAELVEDLLNFTGYYTEEIIKSDIDFEKFLMKDSKSRDKFLSALQVITHRVFKRIGDNILYGTLQ